MYPATTDATLRLISKYAKSRFYVRTFKRFQRPSTNRTLFAETRIDVIFKEILSYIGILFTEISGGGFSNVEYMVVFGHAIELV